MTPAVFVAACALVFTVASFWWLNARRGKLLSYEPHTFAGVVGEPVVLILRFPLVLHNTGPVPLVVQDLRLRFPAERLPLPLPWRTSRIQLKPTPGDDGQMPSAFAVPGRSAETHFIEFGAPFPGLSLEARDYQALIEVKLGHEKKWATLVDFTLRIGHMVDPEHYISYNNAPNALTKEDLANAHERLRQVMERVSRTSQTANQGNGQAEEDPQ